MNRAPQQIHVGDPDATHFQHGESWHFVNTQEMNPKDPGTAHDPGITRAAGTADPARFLFRLLHPRIHMGTASDRYSGWVGQIYSEPRYQGRMVKRSKKIGGRSFEEVVLPVDSVREYFDHFEILELDYTFYSVLLDTAGEPTRTFQVLKAYSGFLSPDDHVLLKVPQVIFAQKLRRGAEFVSNPAYLDTDVFVRSFYEPAMSLLGHHLRGFIFEQEYRRKDERGTPELLARDLDRFFSKIPKDDRYHVELRTEHYLARPVFDVLSTHGVGQVLSHWTWLPPLKDQFQRAGHAFFNSGRHAVVRLMTPIGTRYEAAYTRAYPFDRIIDGMIQPSMIDDTEAIARESVRQETNVNIIVNNRAGGNAPLIAQRIAERLLGGPAEDPTPGS